MTQRGGGFVDSWQSVRDLTMLVRVSTNPQEVTTLPVVLLHGLGVSGRYMMPTAERLAVHYKVFVPDLPGFGRSDKPRHALGVPALADLLSAWLDGLGIGEAVFLGNSLGCQVIVDLAIRYPGQCPTASHRQTSRGPSWIARTSKPAGWAASSLSRPRCPTLFQQTAG
jgi:2-hydroxy-6-oxonona-2,4-dienedioate hydrolase